jgi:hypothetical protein
MTAEPYLIMLIAALASARVAVLIVHDTILEKPRDWWFRRYPPMDNPILGFDYQSKDKAGVPLPASLRRKWYMTSELLTCTRCMTVWTTPPALLLAHSGQVGRTIIIAVAAMGIASWAAKKV